MRRAFEIGGEIGVVGLGVVGVWWELGIPRSWALALLAMGALLVILRLVSLGFYRSGATWLEDGDEPRLLRLSVVDYFKALVAWLLAFHRTYAVRPGLYFTGERYDPEAPLLVTSNYHLTLFLVARQLRAINARILVIDTDGINVWCTAGKGRFANDEIQRQLRRYPRETLSAGEGPIQLILPKFAMSGVDLRGLKKLGVRPVIGPLYAEELPEYLGSKPYRHRERDRVNFDFRSRSFVWLAGLLQITKIGALLALLVGLIAWPFGGRVPVEMIGMAALIGTAYALLYPWIPGKRFAVKGLWLGSCGVAAFLGLAAVGWLNPWAAVAAAFFVLGTAVLVGLEFTGNSPVSNYSRVRREVARFLPLSGLLYLAALAVFLTSEVLR